MSKTDGTIDNVGDSQTLNEERHEGTVDTSQGKIKTPSLTQWITVVISLIMLGGVLGSSWYGWKYIQVIQIDLSRVSDNFLGLERQMASIKILESSSREVQDDIKRINIEIAGLDTRNQIIIDRTEAVAEQLAKSLVDTRSSYILAEAEYLLKLADQRLLIERNPETALTLMRTAQALLGQLQDGRLLTVRKLLAKDLQALELIPFIDVLGLQADLLALDSVLDDLQLPMRRLTPISSEEKTVVLEQWIDKLSKFIRIRRVDEPITPLVSAADSGRAREILRLSLEQIKVALIREDQALFNSGIAQAKRLSAHFFDVNSGPGFRVLNTLSLLEDIQIARPIPDAAQGLRALKIYRQTLTNERAAASEVNQ